MKLLPTMHPSFIQRGAWPLLAQLRLDIEKAKQESTFPEVRQVPLDYNLYAKPHDVVKMCQSSEVLSIDIETEENGAIICVGFSDQAGRALSIDFNSFQSVALDVLGRACVKVAHNCLFDFPRLETALGLKIAGPWFDTMVAHALCQPDLRHGLEAIAADMGWDRGPWKHLSQNELRRYNCIDVDVTIRAYHTLCKWLTELNLWSVFHRTMKLLPVLRAMQERGIRIDQKKCKAIRDEFAQDDAKLHTKFYKLIHPYVLPLTEIQSRQIRDLHKLREAGEVWIPVEGMKRGRKIVSQIKHREKARDKVLKPDLDSHQQMKDLLYVRLDLKRPWGRDSTDDDALTELRRRTKGPRLQILELLARHREIAASKKYLTHSEDIIHPSWLCHATGTGRLACRDPNVMNIPVRRPGSERIQEIYGPVVEGNIITAADYSQIERRLQAWYSKDKALCEAFEKGEDVHKKTAAMALNKPIEDVTKKERYIFKRAVYLESYGGGKIKLQRTLALDGIHISTSQADAILEMLKDAHPGYQASREETLRIARREKMLRNPYGRIRWFLKPDPWGEALNFIYQSTTADKINDDMVELHERFEGTDCYLQAQEHDKVIVEHPPRDTEWVQAQLREVMEAPVPHMGGWSCPIDIKTGPTWRTE